MIEELWIDCDNLVIRDGVRDEETGQFLNPTDDSATCVFSLLDSSFAAVGGATYANVSMTYVDDSDGRWIGTLDEAATLTEGSVYYIKIVVSASDDRKDTIYLKRIARRKGG
jgi:hypothetical protein